MISSASSSVVAGNPLLLPGGVVLDRGVIKTGARAKALACHVDIARTVNRKRCSFVKPISRPVVACNPLFLPGRIVLNRGVIIIAASASAESRYIHIA